MSNHSSLTNLSKPPHAVYTLRHPDVQGLRLKVCFVQFSEGEIPMIIGYHSSNGVWWHNDPAKYDSERPWTPATMEDAVAAWHRYRANGWRREVL